MDRTLVSSIVLTTTLASAAIANNERRITPDEPLFIEFRVDAGASVTPDTLVVVLGQPEALEPGTGERVTVLRNGALGIGVHQTSAFGDVVGAIDLDPAAAFIDSASPYTETDPGVVDPGALGAMALGTESGLVQVTVTTGELIVDLDDVRLEWGVGTGPDSIDPSDMQPEITAMYVGSPCYADFDRSGQLDIFDFLAYIAAFGRGDYRADCDGCGTIDLFDYLCFLRAFDTGCPE